MRYPEYLKKGGTIGFVAPSFGCSTEPYRTAFDRALGRFAALGYKLDLGPNCYAADGIGISSTPDKCAQELTEYYTDSANDVLISCGGGELMCGILDYIDFDRIASAPPKWYMGFSDNTNFTFLLTTICDVASLYAPCASTFGMEPWHESLEDAYGLLTGALHTVKGYPAWERESLKNADNPCPQYNLTEKKELVYYIPDKASGGRLAKGESTGFQGRLVGGCIDCLANLTGTCFDNVGRFNERYREDGIVWFLEACDLNVMSIRRALWNMEHAGWFKYVRGFIIGRPLCFGSELMGMNQYNAVTGILGKYNVPIIMDADIGHLPPMMPLVCGSYAVVEAEGNDITVDMRIGR